MQTKQQIQRLLSSAGVSARHGLGQHFLIDLNLMRLLVDSADIAASDVVLEVGCGTGSLTEALVEKAACVIAVEIDTALARIAQAELAGRTNLEIINADVLRGKNRLNPLVLKPLKSARERESARLLLVANLPYKVAAAVIMNLTVGPTAADAMYVTVQKEVAQRMTALPGSEHYGTLSILLTCTGQVKTIRVLKPTVFWPMPKVDSAMVSFVRQDKKVQQISDIDLLCRIVSLFMQHRRKMLKACTKFAAGKLGKLSDWNRLLLQAAVDPNRRPDQLSPNDYLALANCCHDHLCSQPPGQTAT